jgi:hypothetical protein
VLPEVSAQSASVLGEGYQKLIWAPVVNGELRSASLDRGKIGTTNDLRNTLCGIRDAAREIVDGISKLHHELLFHRVITKELQSQLSTIFTSLHDAFACGASRGASDTEIPELRLSNLTLELTWLEHGLQSLFVEAGSLTLEDSDLTSIVPKTPDLGQSKARANFIRSVAEAWDVSKFKRTVQASSDQVAAGARSPFQDFVSLSWGYAAGVLVRSIERQTPESPSYWLALLADAKLRTFGGGSGIMLSAALIRRALAKKKK